MEQRLRDFVRGDEAAFETLFREYQREVYGWIVRLVRDRSAAEDLTIETFWRIHRSRARFDPARSFGAWARRIAVNVAIDHLKRIGGERWREWRDEPGGTPVDRVASGEMRRLLAAAFYKLPPTLQVAARLALIEERPYQDIADALGVSIGAVKSRVFRATRLLRRELARAGLQP
jgi:RNA polymerase sigma-70 factor (ECF subfamily)